jgi:hypothetical protein
MLFWFQMLSDNSSATGKGDFRVVSEGSLHNDRHVFAALVCA